MRALRIVLERRELTPPPSVQAATAKFRTEADPLRSYIEERIEGKARHRVARQEIYQDYAAWAVNNGFQAMSTVRFYESLTHLLAELIPHETGQVRRNDGRYYVGIRLIHAN